RTSSASPPRCTRRGTSRAAGTRGRRRRCTPRRRGQRSGWPCAVARARRAATDRGRRGTRRPTWQGFSSGADVLQRWPRIRNARPAADDEADARGEVEPTDAAPRDERQEDRDRQDEAEDDHDRVGDGFRNVEVLDEAADPPAAEHPPDRRDRERPDHAVLVAPRDREPRAARPARPREERSEPELL